MRRLTVWCSALVLPWMLLVPGAAEVTTPVLEQEGPRILVFGITPWYGKPETARAFQPFVEYLSQQLERPVTFYIARNYADLGDRLERGLVHFGYFSPTVYVQTARTYPAMRYMVTVANERGFYFQGYMIARADSGVRRLRDLAGKSFAFTDPDSTSGYRMPALMIRREMGVDPDRFLGEMFFMGSHAAALRAVYEGTVAGAAVAHHVFEEFAHNDELHILAKTPPLPEGAIAAHHRVPEALVDATVGILLATDTATTNRAGEAVLEAMPYKGFVLQSDAFYDSVRDMLEAFGE